MTMDKPSPALSKGEQFLQDNKSKDGVVTLPSGLQYKVLVEGSGLKRPLVDTPCDCHYLGTCDLGVPRCCGGFTPSTRVVSGRGRGWFLFRF